MTFAKTVERKCRSAFRAFSSRASPVLAPNTKACTRRGKARTSLGSPEGQEEGGGLEPERDCGG